MPLFLAFLVPHLVQHSQRSPIRVEGPLDPYLVVPTSKTKYKILQYSSKQYVRLTIRAVSHTRDTRNGRNLASTGPCGLFTSLLSRRLTQAASGLAGSLAGPVLGPPIRSGRGCCLLLVLLKKNPH